MYATTDQALFGAKGTESRFFNGCQLGGDRFFYFDKSTNSGCHDCCYRSLVVSKKYAKLVCCNPFTFGALLKVAVLGGEQYLRCSVNYYNCSLNMMLDDGMIGAIKLAVTVGEKYGDND
jgi:hypothetical protein